MKLKNVKVLNFATRKIDQIDFAEFDGTIEKVDFCEAKDVSNLLFVPKLCDNFDGFAKYKCLAFAHSLKRPEQVCDDFVLQNKITGVVPCKEVDGAFRFCIGGKKALYFDDIANLEEEQIEKLCSISVEESRLVFVKTLQGLFEAGAIVQKFGKTAVRLLEDFGFFDRPCIMVSAGCIDKEDVEILVQYNVGIVLTLCENAYFLQEIPQIKYLQDCGVNLYLGTGDFFKKDIMQEAWQLWFFVRQQIKENFDEAQTLEIATSNMLGRQEYFAMEYNQKQDVNVLCKNILWNMDIIKVKLEEK